jgi:CubicO group peptidase (beta-lactamase class C family)
MSLDDSVQKYVEGLDPARYYPTLRRLITHTSGYSINPINKGDYPKLITSIILASKNQGMFPFDLDFAKMKKLLQEKRLENKDYAWKYNNFGFALVGYAIGVASGTGYRAAMSNFLSTELGLAHSFTGTDPSRNIEGYTRRNIPCGNWVWSDDLTAPAGDISSTAEDLLTYAAINMQEERPYLAICHQKYANFKSLVLKSGDMGLGWLLDKENNRIIWHIGATVAFSSYLGIDKDKKRAVVVLSNYRIDPNKIGKAVLEGSAIS